jgi:hypothetical protein
LAGDDFPLAEYIPAAEPFRSSGGEPSTDAGAVGLPGSCCGPGAGHAACSPPSDRQADESEASSESGSNEPSKAGEGDAAPVLLICPSCNEAFSPRFYRACAQCGHDFGEGVETESAEHQELNDRVLLALLAFGGLAIGLVIYFWFLFRS